MIELIISIGLLTIGFFVGGAREKKHFEQLKIREAQLKHKIAVKSYRGVKATAGTSFLVTGNVVIASDQFKNFVGALKSFFGGRMSAQETLLDRARREAMCRLQESALQNGAQEIIDVHMTTRFLDQMGVEICAYGTALRQ